SRLRTPPSHPDPDCAPFSSSVTWSPLPGASPSPPRAAVYSSPSPSTLLALGIRELIVRSCWKNRNIREEKRFPPADKASKRWIILR
ncbi:hypothetical protein Taro_037508, partial [Colocasia esculenta]|nr:hypothetical protein [Colocasia esculenta]